jgi:6,7-dimethyl-8-ribityllumazine synthase
MPEFRGELRTAPDDRYAIVVSDYNESITRKLLAGAVETLRAAGVAEEAIDVARVPGAWELPVVAKVFAKSKRHDAVICLGCVIKGETTHDEHINRQVSTSLGALALKTGVPIVFGVLTCQTLEQALNRAGGAVGHKGVEAAETAVRMVRLLESLGAKE